MNRMDFEEFVHEGRAPGHAVSLKILETVRRDLNPAAWSVFSKLALIHFVVGAATLLLCPQFGIRLAGSGLGVMKYFIFLGDYACTALCGAIFVGSSALAAAVLLRPEEIRVIRRQKILQLATLSLLSLGVFIMAEATILAWFGMAWAAGALIGGMGALELGWRLRLRAFA